MEKIKKKINPHSGISIAGLVTGVLSLILFWFPGVHLILGVLGIVFGGIATSKKQRFGLAGLITAIAGFVIGWGYLLLAFFIGFASAL